MKPSPTDPEELLRPKRKWSLWTLLAPVGLVFVVVLMVGAVNEGTRGKTKSTSTKSTSTKASTVAAKPKSTAYIYKVKAGDSLGAISTQFGLSEADITTCNPRALTDSHTIQPGMRLHVNQAFCDKRVKAARAKADKLVGLGSGSSGK